MDGWPTLFAPLRNGGFLLGFHILTAPAFARTRERPGHPPHTTNTALCGHPAVRISARMSHMWPHFLNLLARSWRLFLVWMGTTGLGFLTPVVVFLLTVVVTLLVIAAQRGTDAMKDHWKETAALTVGATLCVMLLVYGPIFGWSVIRTVYSDHENLASRVTQLTNSARPACPPSTATIQQGPKIDILYGAHRLNGRTVMSDTTSFVSLGNLHLKNVGDKTSDPVSARLYIAVKMPQPFAVGGGPWPTTQSEEPDFPLAFYYPGMGEHPRINPTETWNVPVFQLQPPTPWTKPIKAKLKVFYGASKPAEAEFTIIQKETAK